MTGSNFFVNDTIHFKGLRVKNANWNKTPLIEL